MLSVVDTLLLMVNEASFQREEVMRCNDLEDCLAYASVCVKELQIDSCYFVKNASGAYFELIFF